MRGMSGPELGEGGWGTGAQKPQEEGQGCITRFCYIAGFRKILGSCLATQNQTVCGVPWVLAKGWSWGGQASSGHGVQTKPLL